jgi:hypothetical protein
MGVGGGVIVMGRVGVMDDRFGSRPVGMIVVSVVGAMAVIVMGGRFMVGGGDVVVMTVPGVMVRPVGVIVMTVPRVMAVTGMGGRFMVGGVVVMAGRLMMRGLDGGVSVVMISLAMTMGLLGRMGGGVTMVVVAMRVRGRGRLIMSGRGRPVGVIVVTVPGVMAVVVVRLVLVAHSDPVPQPLFAVFQRQNRYNVIKPSARLRSPRRRAHTDARR